VSKLIAIAILLGAGIAAAAPGERVLLADPDPELLHAVESSLAPWKLAVVVDRTAPKDERTAHERAETTKARFVVWRERDQLVVFDRDRDAIERRPARAGAFDPVTAAGAALTVKTMMRLPPPPPEEKATPAIEPTAPAGVIAQPAPAQRGGVEIRAEAGLAGRASGDGLGGRFVFAAMLRPTRTTGLRFGLRGDIGTAGHDIDQSGFKGTWSDWSVLGAISFTHAWGNWELEPWIAAGLTRGSLDGTEMSAARTESATLFDARAAACVRRRYGLLTTAVFVEAGLTPGAPTYTRATTGMGMPAIYEAPGFSVLIGAAIAADFGRD
jgi:hypothetical protein